MIEIWLSDLPLCLMWHASVGAVATQPGQGLAGPTWVQFRFCLLKYFSLEGGAQRCLGQLAEAELPGSGSPARGRPAGL